MVAGRPSFRYQILSLLLALLMVFTLIGSLATFWRADASLIVLLSIALVGAGLAWISWRVRWSGAVIVLLVGACAIIGVIYLPEWAAYVRSVSDQAIELYTNLRAYKFDSTFGSDLATVMLAAIGLGTGGLIVREALSQGNTFWSITLGAAIFGSEWASFFDKSLTFFLFYMLLAGSLWVLAQAGRRDAKWLSTGRRIGYRSHVVTPLVGILLLTFIAGTLPSKFEPLDLGALGDKVLEAFPVFKRMRGGGGGSGGSRFSLLSTGFAPTVGALGGPVTLDNTASLQVEVDHALDHTIYLRGLSFVKYDGVTWLPGDSKYQVVAKEGLFTTYASAVPLETTTYTFTPLNSMGGTVFSELEPMRVDGLKSAYKSDHAANLLADRVIGRGTSYTTISQTPKYSFDQIVAISKGLPADEFKPYLSLPTTLPRRVGELARQVTAGQVHPFQKAVQLENYLRSMRYDLNVPTPPPGRDFVDNFLFDLKSGYCTYFASAMTIMLRDLGIPARFVEGFALPSSTSFTEGKSNVHTYSVLNSQAHAWVEAYFPGYGWVTFDPTPRADLPRIDRSFSVPKPPDSSTTGTEPTTPGVDPTAPDKRLQNGQDLPELGQGGGSPTSLAKRPLPWAVLVILLLAGGIALIYGRIRRQDRIRATVDREVVQEAWTKTGGLLQRFGFGRKDYQTANEYARAIGNSWPELREAAAQVALDYTTARYAAPESQPTALETSRARSLWADVHQALFARYGWRTYLLRRLRLLKVKGPKR